MNKNTTKEKKILVTGGSGFLGSHVVESLCHSGFKVRVFDSKIFSSNINNVESIIGDLNDSSLLDQAFKNIDIVFHFAALADLDIAKNNPIDTLKINVMGTANIMEAARRSNVERVIFSSSIYVHSRTGGFYRVSKHACELLLEEYYNRYKIPYTILRFGTLYGPRADKSNSVYLYLYESLHKGKIKVSGNGEEVREYIDVRDAADICVKIIKKNYANQTLIITGKHRMRLSELLETINEILDNKVLIKYGRHKDSHYKYTPYSYNPRIGKNITLDSYRDLGQGIIEILGEIDNN